MWSPKSIILVISSTLLLSVKKKVPTRSDSRPVPAVPLVLLPGFDHVTLTAKRPLSRQSVWLPGRQEPAAAPATDPAALTRLGAAWGPPCEALIQSPEEPAGPPAPVSDPPATAPLVLGKAAWSMPPQSPVVLM